MFFFRMTTAAMFTMLAIAPVLAQEADAGLKPLSFKECGAQYQKAKADGSLGDKKWMDYRKDVCSITAPAFRPKQTTVKSEPARFEAVRRVAFPAALATEFSSEKPWKARMRTCLKSYHEAKKAGALYGLKWVEKGGGYYSLCSAKLRENSKV